MVGFVTDSLVFQALERHVTETALVLDNGPTRAPKRLEAWLAQEAQDRQWPVVVTVYWLPTYASSLDQVEIWFSILQLKVLTRNHFVSKVDLQMRILGLISHHNVAARPIACRSLSTN